MGNEATKFNLQVSTPPSLSCQAPSLNLQTVQTPFLGNPSLYIGFSWNPP